MSECVLCQVAIVHDEAAHQAYEMLHRWLTWVSEWGDQDMLQALVADTIKLLTKGGGHED